MPETETEWVEAPPASNTRWSEVLAPLMANPGQWAIIARKDSPKTAYTTALNLRRRIKSVPEGRWEFIGQAGPENTGVVKACYLGPK